MSSLSCDDYHVGIVCALSSELAAARSMLDKEHGLIPSNEKTDSNVYYGGQIHEHNVVIACLPAGVDGLAAAAIVANNMSRTFTQLRFGLLVGIGGGVPDLGTGIDIRLGDVVVSKPTGTHGGVVQYDKGKSEDGGQFIRKGNLNSPPPILLNALQSLIAEHDMEDSRICEYMENSLQRRPKMRSTGYTFPGADKDVFHDGHIVFPRTRSSDDPQIHYGTIASGNTVIKDAVVRDGLKTDCQAICVEMEAAGLMNNFPCLVIRGICDYADLYKNDIWHKYAAIAAAAFAKELLLHISVIQTERMTPVQKALDVLDDIAQNIQSHHRQTQIQYENDKHRKCHQAFKTSTYEDYKNRNPSRAERTCLWAIEHPKFTKWRDNTQDDLLWISADPGCGKSVLAKSLIDHDLRSLTPASEFTICYFFFKDNELQDRLHLAFSALLHQLFAYQPQLLEHAYSTWEINGNSLCREVDGMWRILQKAVKDSSAKPVMCVLDALDECKEDDRRRLINMLCEFYDTSFMRKSGLQRLKFLVTSRAYDDIQHQFHRIPKQLPSIRLRGEHENDRINREIDLVIGFRVKEMSDELQLNDSIQKQLLDKLLGMKHRTYLWLYLTIESIRKELYNNHKLNDISFEVLPDSVNKVYEHILNRATQTQKQKHLVRTILQIVVGARRPLTTGEMTIALELSLSETSLQTLKSLDRNKFRLESRISQWCGLFVFVNHSRVYLIHQTAKEFLLNNRNDGLIDTIGWKHCFGYHETELTMARICINHLTLIDLPDYKFKKLVMSKSRHPRWDSKLSMWSYFPKEDPDDEVETFTVYSAEHWQTHLSASEVETLEDAMPQMMSLYDTQNKVYRIWAPRFWSVICRRPSQMLFPDMNALELAAISGNMLLAKQLLDRRAIGIEARITNAIPFLLAQDRDHRGVLEFLLMEGVVDIEVLNDMLYEAVTNGYKIEPETLMRYGADVNARDPQGVPLLAKALRWYDDSAVLWLIDHGAHLNTLDSNGESMLYLAFRLGEHSRASLLMNKGADINVRNAYGSPLLHRALLTPLVSTIEVLVHRGADVNVRDESGQTALHIMSWCTDTAEMSYLIRYGAYIDAQDHDGKTPLLNAVHKGHTNFVQYMIKVGADVNIADNEGRTPLSEAVRRHDEEIARILRENGAKE